MFVSLLTLAQFRSHTRTRLALDGRPVVLHGPNGAGKTNVLEAVSLLSPGRGLRGAGAEELMRHGSQAGWKIAAELGGAREVETWAEPGGPRQVRLDAKPQPQVALGRVLRVLWLTPAMDRLWTEAPEGRRRFLDRMTMSFEPAHAEAVLAYDRAMRERNRLLRDRMDDLSWFDAIEGRMAEAGALVARRRRSALARILAAQDAAGPFPAAELVLAGPDGRQEPGSDPGASEPEIAREAEALADALRAVRERDFAAGRTTVGPHRADLLATYAEKGVSARLCSTGEQKALLISLVLANARALTTETGAAPVLLLDEVAAHLDEARRAALYEIIVALRAQAWMTGTGRELFAALGDRAQIFAVEETAGDSAVRSG